MKKPLQFNFPAFILLIIVNLFTSFKSNDSIHILKETQNITGYVMPNSILPQPPLNSDTLDVLWVDAQIFININLNTFKRKKITFRYFITDPDSLTMHGWINKKKRSDYDTSSNQKLYLHNGYKSEFRFGNGIYLGNTVIYNDGIETIKAKIKENRSNFVVFIPKEDIEYPGQITYDVFVSNIKPTKDNKSTLVLGPTGVITNPSPPRNSN